MIPLKPICKAILCSHWALLLFLLAGCSGAPKPVVTTSPVLPSPVLSSTLAPPSPTPIPVPLAASVNGEPITLADFQAEVERYQAAQSALGKTPAAEQARQIVLEDMIDRALLAQAAGEAGFRVDENLLQTRIDRLAAQLGGVQALKDWQSAHGYSEADFRKALGVEIRAAWQRDQVAGAVPVAAEQVHARQILVLSEEGARKVEDQLRSGLKFATLAYKYDPVSGGDLGWFPRGYLDLQEIESAAFSLQPEQTSGVIQSKLGYHLIELIERDPQRPLNSDQRLVLQKKALKEWLDARRASSQVEVLVP